MKKLVSKILLLLKVVMMIIYYYFEAVRINNEINKRIATSHLIKEKINHLNIILEKQKKWNEQLEVDLVSF
jgi:hypothetical protein